MSRDRVSIRDRIAFARRAAEAARNGMDMDEFMAAEEEREGMDLTTLMMLIELLLPILLRLFNRD